MNLVETLNRTIKLAMDEGRVKSYQDAVALFGSFRLRLTVSPEFSSSAGEQAAVLTLLRAAPKTFLGGVELVGPLEERCSMAWYAGKPLGDVALACGVNIKSSADPRIPTIHVGFGAAQGSDFWMGVIVRPDGFVLDPDGATATEAGSSVEAGVAAAGAALNQAFQHLYRRSPLAGQRRVAWRLPVVQDASRPGSLWLVGLGHLGQALLWTTALKGGDVLPRTVKLTDDDVVSKSSLSTCLLVDATDVGRKKVDAVGDRLEALQMQVQRDDTRIDLDANPIDSEHALCAIAVDNLALRRSLDRLRSARLIEAGIGDGADAFTRVQVHAFPGPRLARDVWAGDDAKASQAVNISQPAYQALLSDTNDECGTTLVAGRAVATPFIGAFAGAVLANLVTAGKLPAQAWNFDVNSL